MSERKRLLLLGGGIPLGLILLVIVAWAVDATMRSGQVMRNVSVDGTALTGLERTEVDAMGSQLTNDLTTAVVTVHVGDEQIETDAYSLGGRIDGAQLADDALAAHRDGFILLRPVQWIGSFFGDVTLEIPHTVDSDAAQQAAEQLLASELDDPIEPTIDTVNGQLEVIPGSDGATIDPDELIAELPAMLAGGEPYSITLDPIAVNPASDAQALQTVADEANDATDADIVVQLLDREATITSQQLRSWVILDLDAEPPSWNFDSATMIAEVTNAIGPLGSDEQRPHFNIVDGRPIIVPAAETVVCCDEGSADHLRAELLAGADRVELQVTVTGGDAGVRELEQLGIIEEISSFTTEHPCCQGRVTNIQLMADIVRGTVIRPGESFSLNGHVGRRTAERGFVPGGAIASGVMEQQIGGGVSQFATTLFNAGFFAGIEIPEYQSHSIYFSRYPRGREATVSWPKPDLVLHNNTPYGILIWTSYSSTSITVTMYSTKHIQVEDIGRSDSAQGACTRVTTTRQRSYDDGRTETDTFFAVYRPAEGRDCAGNSTTPTTTPPTTTEAPPSSETPPTDPTPTTTTTAPPPTDPTPTDPPPTDPEPPAE